MRLFLISRQHNIEENMTIAMEEAPESFGQVVMLYINCKVNGHPVKAFVDSGSNVLLTFNTWGFFLLYTNVL